MSEEVIEGLSWRNLLIRREHSALWREITRFLYGHRSCRELWEVWEKKQKGSQGVKKSSVLSMHAAIIQRYMQNLSQLRFNFKREEFIFSRAIESTKLNLCMQLKIDYNFYVHMTFISIFNDWNLWLFMRMRYDFQVLFAEQTSWLRYVFIITQVRPHMLQFIFLNEIKISIHNYFNYIMVT